MAVYTICCKIAQNYQGMVETADINSIRFDSSSFDSIAVLIWRLLYDIFTSLERSNCLFLLRNDLNPYFYQ